MSGKRILAIFLATCLILAGSVMIDNLLVVKASVQAEFYVSTSGSDTTGDGSSSSPWATIQKARDHICTNDLNDDMTGDIIVYVAAGDYYVDSAIEFTEQDSGATYNVAENGGIGWLQYKSGDLSPSGWDLDDAELVVWPWGECDWNRWTLPITSIDTSTRRINFEKYGDADYVSVGSDARYYIEGVYDLLDQPGEFYLDTSSGWLYYYPYDGNPNNQTIIAPKVTSVIKITGSSASNKTHNIVFEGLAVECSDFAEKMCSYYIMIVIELAIRMRRMIVI